jgi:hypothetical protein
MMRGRWLWIPGSRLMAGPGMTQNEGAAGR